MHDPDRPTTGYRPRAVALALVLGCLAGGVGASLLGRANPTRQRTEAEAAVSAVLDAQNRAWNAGDLDEFMAYYWRSDDLTFFSGGTVTKGWDATLERYRKRYQSDGKEMGTLTFSDIAVDVLGPDVATARGRWKVVTSKETFEGLFTLVLKRLSDGWRIVHDHTSMADKP